MRTTFPTGSPSFGTPYGFSWQLAGDVVKITFPSGYTDLVTLAAYDSGRDFLTRTSSSTGVGPGTAAAQGRSRTSSPSRSARELDFGAAPRERLAWRRPASSAGKRSSTSCGSSSRRRAAVRGVPRGRGGDRQDRAARRACGGAVRGALVLRARPTAAEAASSYAALTTCCARRSAGSRGSRSAAAGGRRGAAARGRRRPGRSAPGRDGLPVAARRAAGRVLLAVDDWQWLDAATLGGPQVRAAAPRAAARQPWPPCAAARPTRRSPTLLREPPRGSARAGRRAARRRRARPGGPRADGRVAGAAGTRAPARRVPRQPADGAGADPRARGGARD